MPTASLSDQVRQMVFEIATGPDGKPDPRPRMARVPDGVRFFSVKDAAAKTGKSEQSLITDWTATFTDIVMPPMTETEDVSDEGATSGGAESPLSAVEMSPAMRVQVQKVDPFFLEVLRSQRFPELADDDLVQVIGYCTIKGFDPFTEVWAERLPDEFHDNQERLFIGPTYEGLCARADRTGLFAGCDAVKLEYASPDDEQFGRPPIAATARIYKLVQGQRCAFEHRVLWNDFYGRRSAGWQNLMPGLAIGKCAEAGGIRKAFRQLGKAYIREEMGNRDPSPRGNALPPGQAMSEIETAQESPTEEESDVTSRGTFDQALLFEFAVRSDAERTRILQAARQYVTAAFRGIDPESPEYWVKMIRAVRAQPRTFGVQKPATAVA